MKKLFLLFLPCISLAATISPTPFPVFLKAGFSSILEFDDSPTKVVLGDGQSFQVEKLEHSLVIKTLTPYATTNMFAYFKNEEPRLFVLTASEDAEPTYYKKFDPPLTSKKITALSQKAPPAFRRDARAVFSKFDPKKDYLTVDIEVSADSKEAVKPQWKLVRLAYNKTFLTPMKLWSEREAAQKDSKIKARFIFAKPNIPRNLKDVTLIVPTQSALGPFNLILGGSHR